MRRTVRRALWWLLAVALLVPAYAWFVLEGQRPGPMPYALDLPTIRRLAQESPGPRPAALRYEHVADFQFRGAMIMAGDTWAPERMAVLAYQLVYPDRTLIIDAAMDRSLARPEMMVPFFDDAAYARLQRALEQAALIAITHEHLDHAGGLARHPRLAALRPALRLTEEQIANPDRMKPATWPQGALDGYEPLRYERMLALAPGVVLIEAPGHTPGSQMVYVQLEDGRELLLLGDVSWKGRNIERARERPRFMTALIQEDRGQVLGQLQALQALARSEPALHLVPGHDGEIISRLAAQGLLQRGFQLR